MLMDWFQLFYNFCVAFLNGGHAFAVSNIIYQNSYYRRSNRHIGRLGFEYTHHAPAGLVHFLRLMEQGQHICKLARFRSPCGSQNRPFRELRFAFKATHQLRHIGSTVSPKAAVCPPNSMISFHLAWPRISSTFGAMFFPIIEQHHG